MKKSILKACLILAIFAAASAAHAAATINTGTSIGSLSFSPSNNVWVKVSSTASGYVSESLHKTGSRVFGTDSVASIIYWKDATIASTAPTSSFSSTMTAPTATGVAGTPAYSTDTSWHSM